jgi:Domain of unknown function (DUF4249)
MNAGMKYFLLTILVGLLLSSCLPDPLEVKNIPTLKPRLVVSSQIIPNNTVSVLLTRSIGALDAGNGSDLQALLKQIVVNDAVVTIHYGDQVDTLVFIQDGIYVSGLTPLEAGVEYTLEASSPSTDPISATTTMHEQVAFNDVDAHLTYSGKDTLAEVNYSFRDPVGKNWYMIAVQRLRANQNFTENLNPRIFVKVMKDDEFEGNVKSENFTVPFRRFSVGDTVSVILANVSEQYYDYLKQTVDNRNSISAFVSDPLNYQSNVVNGYGYFNMHLQDTHLFIMK